MGYSTLIDIIGSTVVGGLLFLILLRMNEASVMNNYQYSGERIVQQNLVEVVTLIEYDFRKIGYCNKYNNMAYYSDPDSSKSIFSANSSSIAFLTDIPQLPSYPFGDNKIDTIRYYLGSTSELSSTTNPRDRVLHRVVNGNAAKGVSLGVTQFTLTYYDSDGDKITAMPSKPPFGIASIQIDVAVENPAADDSANIVERRAIWRQIRLASRNFFVR